MIFAYKIMTDKVKINASDLFTKGNRTMRGHQYKITKEEDHEIDNLKCFQQSYR